MKSHHYSTLQDRPIRPLMSWDEIAAEMSRRYGRPIAMQAVWKTAERARKKLKERLAGLLENE